MADDPQWQVESTRPAQSGDWDVASTRPAVPLPAQKPTLYPILFGGPGGAGETTKTPAQQMGLKGFAEGAAGGIPGFLGDAIEAPQDLANLALSGVKKLTGKDFTFKPHTGLPTSEQLTAGWFGPPKNDAEAAEREVGDIASQMLIQPLKEGALAAGRPLSRLAEKSWHAMFPAKFKAAMAGKMAGVTGDVLENEIHQQIGETARLQEQAHAQTQEVASRQDKLDAVRAAVENHTDSDAKARAAVGIAQQQMDSAENLGKHLAAQEAAMAQPSSPAQFAETIQNAAWQDYEQLTTARRVGAGFDQAITSAGDAKRVNVEPVVHDMDVLLGDEEKELPGRLANPSLEANLNFIKSKLGNGHISLYVADSLRRTIMRVIHKQEALLPAVADTESVSVLKKAYHSILDAAKSSWTPFADAMDKYAELSRPLDIYRIGAPNTLSKLVARDPFSLEFELHEAQVIGELLRISRRGTPALSRMISVEPRLREMTKLYFADDLFGQGKTINAANFARWLKINEEPLKQAGIYDDFSTLQAAHKTLETRLEAATNNLSEAKMKAAAHKNVLDIAKQQAQIEKQGLEDAQNGRAITEKQILGFAQGTRQYQKIRAEINVDLESGNAERMYNHVSKLLSKLYDDGSMNVSDYQAALRDLNAAKDQIANTALFARRLRRIALGAIILKVENPLVRRNWYSVKNMLGL